MDNTEQKLMETWNKDGTPYEVYLRAPDEDKSRVYPFKVLDPSTAAIGGMLFASMEDVKKYRERIGAKKNEQLTLGL